MTIHRLIVRLESAKLLDIEVSTFDNATIDEVLATAFSQSYFIVSGVLYKNTAQEIAYLDSIAKEPTSWIGDEEEE